MLFEACFHGCPFSPIGGVPCHEVPVRMLCTLHYGNDFLIPRDLLALIMIATTKEYRERRAVSGLSSG